MAIVGGGPAGLSCARDLAELGYATTVFEAQPVAGGMLRVGIPDYRMPPEVIQREVDTSCAPGLDLRLSQRCRDRLHRRRTSSTQGYKAVFLAPGLHTAPRRRPRATIWMAVPRPSSSCASSTWRRPLPVGDRVVVIGGGDVALDTARSAPPRDSPARSPQVTLVYRRTKSDAGHHDEVEEGPRAG